MADRCKAMLYGPRVTSRRCTRTAVRDGYCKQHHPDATKERRQASDARHRKQQAQSPWARLEAANRMIEALTKALHRMCKIADFMPDEVAELLHAEARKLLASAAGAEGEA